MTQTTAAPPALLPCPFCAERLSLVGEFWRHSDNERGGCLFDGLSIHMDNKKEIAAWNRRAPAAPEADVREKAYELMVPLLGGAAPTNHWVNTIAAALQSERDAAKAAVENMREGWVAMRLIRDAIEELGPVGSLPASEHLGPTFTHEAEALVEGIRRMASAAKAAEAKGYARGIEDAAALIENNQATTSIIAGEQRAMLTKRYEGNVEGLAYAKAIRALASATGQESRL